MPDDPMPDHTMPDDPKSRQPSAAATRPDPHPRRTFMPFRTPVRGHPFAARPPGASRPRAGQRATLRREPTHPIDPWAVAVWLDTAGGPSWRIGYLDRAVAARLAPRMDREGLQVHAVVDDWWPTADADHERPVVLLRPAAAQAAPDGTPVRRAASAAGAPAVTGDRHAASRDERSRWGEPPRSVRRIVTARTR